MSETVLLVTTDRRDESQLRRILEAERPATCVVAVTPEHARRALDLVVPDGVFVRVEPASTGDAVWLATLVEASRVPVVALARGSAAARLAAGLAFASGVHSVVRLDGDARRVGAELSQLPGDCTPDRRAVG